MLKFTKMQGLGNDYVYIDCIDKEIKNPEILSKIISNRHFGVGSDGLILICKSDKADFKMRMFNSDGSEAEMCGNGIRCVGKYVYDKGLTNKKEITIETLSGIKKLLFLVKEGKVDMVSVDMGNPILKAEDIPVISDNYPVRIKIKSYDKEFNFTCLSVGNPHAVTIIDDIDNFDVEKYGKDLEVNPIFPNRSNIEFVEIIDRNHIKMRVYERGAGETLSCGSGACAAVYACYLNNLTDNEVIVKLLGGDLYIKIEEDNHINMIGNADIVFDGNLYLDEKKLELKKERN